MTVDFEAAQAVLDAERAKLVQQLSDMGANEDGDLRNDLVFGEGFADAAAITAERTEVLGLVDLLSSQLDGVDQALAMVADKTYGTCQSCGEEISSERIEARPASVRCVSCKAKG